MCAAKPIPEGCHTLIPHLIVKNAGGAIEFYKQAFGAEELFRMPGPDGKTIVHAQMKLGDSQLYLADEMPGMTQVASPQTIGGTTITLHVWSTNADAAFERAIKAGAKVAMPMMDAFWGDRYGQVTDPFGHRWSIATHRKDMTPQEMTAAMKEAFANMPGK
jgi:PhnB protein